MNSGGTAKWLETLIESQIQNGDRVWLGAGFVEPNENEDPFFKASDGMRIKNLSREISPFLLKDLRAFLEIRSMIKNINPDVINTHTSKAGLLGRLAAISFRGSSPRLVHTYHGHLLYGYFTPWKTWLIVQIERTLAKRTDALIVSGKKVMRELLEKGIGTSAAYHVINPGVKITRKDSKQRCKQSFGLNPERFTVGWVGRMTSIKNPVEVLNLARSNPDIDFLMCGDGELLEEMRLSCTSNVYLPGWVDANDAWGAADIAILTSKNEAQPIALIEAGLHGVPIIALDVGGVEGVVDDGLNGYLVANILEMRVRINELCKSSEVCKSMGTSGQEKMTRDFGINTFISRHLELFRRLVETQT